MVALPCCHVTLSVSKPKNPNYPTELKTIGDHLRKRRLDLGLLQKDVAKQIGVTKCTIQYWETNRVAPTLRFVPRIIEFLGYDPCGAAEPRSLAEELKARRKRLGLSRKRLAELLRIDQSNLAAWENSKHQPTKKSLERLSDFFSAKLDAWSLC